MSGIAGVLSTQHHDLLPKILERIKHRGTFSLKTWNGPNAIFGAVGLDSINEHPGPWSTPSDDRARCHGWQYLQPSRTTKGFKVPFDNK